MHYIYGVRGGDNPNSLMLGSDMGLCCGLLGLLFSNDL